MRGALLERAWVGLRNSAPVRHFRARSPFRSLISSRAARTIDLHRRRTVARIQASRHPDRFAHLETVCLFVGHVKSGGTLLGAMIDAHPDAVMADEVDVLRHLDAGFDRREILEILVKNARREALKGRVTARRLGGYSVAIPGQWQGRFRHLRVVGESRGGPTTRRLGGHPEGLEALRRFSRPAELRFVHVVRNPLDPIAAMVRRGGRSVEDACADYAAQAERLEVIRSAMAPGELITVHYEELTAEPGDTVASVLEHLGLERSAGHIDACVGLVDARRPGERRWVAWSPEQLEQVRLVVGRHGFLAPYRDRVEVPEGPVEW